MKLVVNGFHVRHFVDAWPAPGRPKINQDHLAAQVSQVHLPAVHGGKLDRERFAYLAGSRRFFCRRAADLSSH